MKKVPVRFCETIDYINKKIEFNCDIIKRISQKIDLERYDNLEDKFKFKKYIQNKLLKQLNKELNLHGYEAIK